jgi:hypothetical protein
VGVILIIALLFVLGLRPARSEHVARIPPQARPYRFSAVSQAQYLNKLLNKSLVPMLDSLWLRDYIVEALRSTTTGDAPVHSYDSESLSLSSRPSPPDIERVQLVGSGEDDAHVDIAFQFSPELVAGINFNVPLFGRRIHVPTQMDLHEIVGAFTLQIPETAGNAVLEMSKETHVRCGAGVKFGISIWTDHLSFFGD